MSRRDFGSDNHSPVHPKVMEALARVNDGHAHAYGCDSESKKLTELIRTHFGERAESFTVFLGTGANVVSLMPLCRSFETVICADVSHLNVDEAAAPELHLGAKLMTVPSTHGKISVEDIRPFLVRGGDQHYAQPKVLSLTQPTEFGAVYSRDELKTLCDFAHDRGLWVHIDGARLVNAAASLGCTLGEACGDADVISFGGTKNGLLFGEVVIFRRPEHAKDVRFYRKQAMQLPSKTRYLAAQINEWLGSGLWQDIAQHVNRLAKHLEVSAKDVPGVQITHPVESNAVFAIIPKEWLKPLREESFFYIFDELTYEARWMMSWDNTTDDVDRFVQKLKDLSGGMK